LFLASRMYTGLSAYPELATMLSGLLAIALTGAFYLGLPIGLFTRRLRRLFLNLSLKTWGVVLLGELTVVMFGQILSLSILLMISTSLAVLTVLFASVTLTDVIIFHMIEGRGTD